jgi:hypothetical protein
MKDLWSILRRCPEKLEGLTKSTINNTHPVSALQSSECFIVTSHVGVYFLQTNQNYWNMMSVICTDSRSQWPCGLRCRSMAAWLLWSQVRIPPGAWKFVCCVCCVLSGRGLCNGLITHPEESYRLWHVIVCDQETSCDEETIAHAGLQSQRK